MCFDQSDFSLYDTICTDSSFFFSTATLACDLFGQGETSRRYSTTQLAIRGADVLRAGSGGRSSVSGVTATIFGCSGFVGRYIAQSLGATGTRLVLPYRCDDIDVQHLRVMGDLGMIVPLKDFDLYNEDMVKRAVEGSDLVINLVGAESETWNYSFEDVHVKAAEILARTCKSMGVKRFLHFSALGASKDAPSRRLRTKAMGDMVVREEIGDISTIFKPAPITGPEDRIFRKFASQIKKMPFVPLIDGGKQRLQPIWIRDVALAVTNALQTYESLGKEYHLAGPDVFTVKDLVDFSFKTIREKPNAVSLPLNVAKALAGPGDWLATKSPLRLRFGGMSGDAVDETRTNFVLGTDKSILTAEDLDVIPHRVTEGVPIEFLRHYRAGGYDMGAISIDSEMDGASLKRTVPRHQLD